MSWGWFFYWDNAPVYTAHSVTDLMVKKAANINEHPQYSPDLAPVYLFLFLKVMAILPSGNINDNEIKVAWVGG